MSNKLQIDFQNCYGIPQLKHTFDFSNTKNFAIYAPNGMMKTSFAKTFKDHITNRSTQDQIFPDRESHRIILDQNNKEIPATNFFVIDPYQDDYHAPNIAKLLVNPEIKEEYNKIYQNIENKKNIFLKELKKLSGLKTEEIESQFSLDVALDKKQFITALQRITLEVKEQKYKQFSHIQYKKIFNDKVKIFLQDPDIKHKIKNYITKYDQLLTSSTFFKKGVFTHNNAADIAKNLKENGFFKANHIVNLLIHGTLVEVKTEKQLEELIEEEKKSILSDPELKATFESIDSKLTKNKDLKEFRDILENNQFLFPELENLPFLASKLWIAYCVNIEETYTVLSDEYTQSKGKIDTILKKAKEEETGWHKVVDIFNKRFSVPFIIKIANQEDVMTQEALPVVLFDFNDTENRTAVSEDLLKKILSNGEKRALYLLNIIFEIEAKKEKGETTFFIIDDIADSFDYKNKYAIIEYLQDVSKHNDFFQIILTHNFDFYRTVTSRLNMNRNAHLHSLKQKDKIVLVEEKYQKNPFKYWVKHLDTSSRMLLAAIPFFRNLAEYLQKEESFEFLTNFLHFKDKTSKITLGELEPSIKEFMPNFQFKQTDININYLDLLLKESQEISQSPQNALDLENKILIAIAIRLLAEKFIIGKINDPGFVKSIDINQTYSLIEKYKNKFPTNKEDIALLNQVALITPENIHLNSFMYEPLLDLDIQQLTKLFEKVRELH